jgi:hypothetical protein
MKSLKFLLAAAIVPMFALAPAAHAQKVASTKTEVKLARVVGLTDVSAKGSETLVTVAVEDIGGSTDLSPTQKIHLNLYKKGEMFSTDASFEIGNVFAVNSAKLRADGRIEIKALGQRGEQYLVDVTYLVDARQALRDIGHVTCEDFDCEASENFASAISVLKK